MKLGIQDVLDKSDQSSPLSEGENILFHIALALLLTRIEAKHFLLVGRVDEKKQRIISKAVAAGRVMCPYLMKH